MARHISSHPLHKTNCFELHGIMVRGKAGYDIAYLNDKEEPVKFVEDLSTENLSYTAYVGSAFGKEFIVYNRGLIND